MPLAPVRKVFRSKTPALRVDAHHAEYILLCDSNFFLSKLLLTGGEHLKHPCKSERVFLMRVMLQYFKVLSSFFLPIEERKDHKTLKYCSITLIKNTLSDLHGCFRCSPPEIIQHTQKDYERESKVISAWCASTLNAGVLLRSTYRTGANGIKCTFILHSLMTVQ